MLPLMQSSSTPPPSGTANEVYATPNGSSGSASLRALVSADLPSLTTTGYGGWFGQTIWLPTGAASNVGNITANNKIRLKLFTVPFPMTVTGLAIQITGAVAGTTVDVGLYYANVPGQTQGGFVLNSNGSGGGGSGLSGASNAVVKSTFTKVNIPAGQYWLAFTGTSTGSITSLGYTAITNESVGIALSSSITGASIAWTTTTAATAGILPTGTLGGLATESPDDYAPVVFFAS